MSDMQIVPDLQASLVCDDVRQERGGKFILIGIFDGLVQGPNAHVCPRLCLVNRWCCGTGTFTQRSRIVGPDRVTLVAEGQPIPVTLENDAQIATSVEVYLNLSFHQAGIHWIEILLDHQLKMRYPLLVRKVVASPAQTGQIPSV